MDTIQKYLSSNDSFSVMENLLKSTKRVFNDTSRVTLFVPINRAFTRLPLGGLDDLLNSPSKKQTRENFVASHIANSEIPRNEMKKSGFETESNKRINVLKSGENLFLNDAKVTDVIQLKNGIIYIMEDFLVPPVT